MPFLSLCMIVRDEENVLERCLKSAANLVDEIIVVDTGSKDRTKEIAHSYGSAVYDYEWKSDFADARNYSVSKATGRWILFLDADEYFEEINPHLLKSFLASLDSTRPIGVILPIYNFVAEEQQGNISESKSMRIFARHPDLTFVRPIHEQLISKSGKLIELSYELPIYHSGYTTAIIESKNKFQRNKEIFSRMRDEGQWTRYDSFTLGNEYFAQDRYLEALNCYIEADHRSERQKTWLPLCIIGEINCLMKLERFTEAFEQIRRGQTLWPKACDFFWFEGYLLSQLGFDQEALTALHKAMELAGDSRNQTPYLASPNYGTTLPLQLASSLYIKNFQDQEAVTNLTKLCYANPNHFSALHSLFKILIRTEDPEQIETFVASLYPAPQDHQWVMMLDATVRLGHLSLSSRYWITLVERNIQVPAILQIKYALLHNRPEIATTVLSHELPADRDNDWNLTLHRIRLQWLDRFEEFCPGLDLSPIDAEIVSLIAFQLFREGRYSEYDEWIGHHNALFVEIANRIGDMLFEDCQFDISLDYYSLLLQRESLDATGFENLSRLYLAQGDTVEGLEFLEQAIDRMPERPDLYMIYLVHSTNALKHKKMYSRLVDRFPGLRDFPLTR
jgi:Glycosyltransferases involved in cell wall biogenesis